MNEPRNHLPRDLKLLRYLDALNAGDLEAVAALWEEASHDPELEKLLAEFDGAMFTAIPGNPSSRPERLGRTRRLSLWGIAAGSLAAGCLWAILARPPLGIVDHGSKRAMNQTGTEAAHPSADVSRDLTSLLEVRRDPDEAELPRFVWPLENLLSASTPLDRLD
jgi:hypothetical protein